MGDAAAVLLSHHGDPSGRATPLTAALLDQGAAVLELATGGPCQADVLGGPEAPALPLADLFGGLRALHRQAGAGLVLAVGLGAAGPVALEAAARSAAAGPGPAGSRFVAGAAFGGTRAATVRPGAEPAAAEAWHLRGPMLCDILHQAEAAGPRDPAALPAGEACMAALFPAGARRPAPRAGAAASIEEAPAFAWVGAP